MVAMIKPLEWDNPTETPEYHFAPSSIQNYIITEFPIVGDDKLTVRLLGTSQYGVWFTTLEAAKAAAQSDYESRIRSALVAPSTAVAGGEQEGWRTMDTAPLDKTAIIIAVPTKDRDGFIVGEAYFDPEHYDGDWWWAGTNFGDWDAGPMSDCNHHPPAFWQPLPAAPSATLTDAGKPE